MSSSERTPSQKNWLAHQRNLILVAQEHLRAATREEALADHATNKLPVEVQQKLQRDRRQLRFQDLTGTRAANDELETPTVPLEPVVEAMNPRDPLPGTSTGELEAEISVETPDRGGAGAPPARREDQEAFPPARASKAHEVPVPESHKEELMDAF
jgi:hypothetical protein